MILKNKTKKVGRNDPCPCGSGLKYKKCCLLKKGSEQRDLKDLYLQKYRIRLKEKEDIEGIRKAGQLVLELLQLVKDEIRPGIITDDINTLVHEFTLKNNAVSAPLNYRGFPKSVCVSVNEVVCHGIPGKRVLKDGDIVNVDVTPILNGYYADASQTFFVGSPSSKAQKIVRVTRESLKVGRSMVRPGNTIGDIGWAIQKYAEGEGCSVVREFVGHGVGFEFHEPPEVPHYGLKGKGIGLVPGMVFTIEPMINLGRRNILILEDKWTVVTEDGSLSAQFEQTLVVTENGYESLTPFDL
ncbi:MAG: type I methionyl aminopeptidase [Deltaproteobacteria bacterium]|nr:type I methionyl aminopeptidase [Deltaproteobacteria bacterium]MDL1960326.1 type I methionyl aminopeptidase [Deltaproteobacteria bacterium]